jgi:hypothetical protein
MGDLARTVERLRALRPAYPHAYAVHVGVPAGPGWRPLADVGAAEIAAWCAQAREQDNPGRLASVAAMAVGGGLTHAVLGRVTAALALERRAWDVHAAHLAVHRDAAGDVDQVAVRHAGMLVLPDDPAAGRPGVEVLPDLAMLLDRVAAAAVATLAPLLAAVRAATRFGLVPLWNGAADAVLGAAVYAPTYAGADRQDAGALGLALVDALVGHGALVRGRAVHEPVAWRGRRVAVPVRRACCLYHRTGPQVDEPSDAYCMTCPFLGTQDRARRFEAFLDHLAAEAVTAPATAAP